jgi:hypothetical protein
MNIHNSQKIDALMCLLTLLEQKATKEQKDNIGIAFITKILRLDGKLAEEFVYGHNYAWEIVGHKQKEGIPTNADCANFWKRISEIFFGYFSENDVKILSEQGIDLVAQFKYYLNLREPKSNVLEMIEKSPFAVE